MVADDTESIVTSSVNIIADTGGKAGSSYSGQPGYYKGTVKLNHHSTLGRGTIYLSTSYHQDMTKVECGWLARFEGQLQGRPGRSINIERGLTNGGLCTSRTRLRARQNHF